MKKRVRNRVSQEVSAASMSDIAFLLLIFFLVTTIFALEEGIPMVLPGKSQARQVKVNTKNICRVGSHANGAITVDEEQVSLGQVRSIVERRLASNAKLVVVIESHPEADYGVMVDILDELRLANARRISLKQMKL